STLTPPLIVFQRRLSDPSANITTFVRGGWRARERDSDKSRSENEGLDSLSDGFAEVEAGDLRDGGCSLNNHDSLALSVASGVHVAYA
ncbi:jg80, partial [Pararge aegeria aegeria]